MGSATITNYPDIKPVGYAQLWSAESFVVAINRNWWPGTELRAEDKGDEHGIGARYKVDVPGPCWVIWQGTAIGGQRLLQTQEAERLDNPPGPGFLPVEAGVNVISFGAEPEPEPPEPGEPRTLEEWLEIFIDWPGYNDCEDYDVDIENVEEPRGHVIGIHHLTGAENAGGHNLYIDVLTDSGQLDPDADVLIRNQGGDWQTLDRASDEVPMWNTPLFKDDRLDVTLADSDIVTGISSAHPDEEPGNTLYHHSFYVVFQKVTPQPGIPGLPPNWTPNSLHIYGGGAKAVVSYYVEAEFVTLGIPREQYLEFWHKCEQLLEDAISEFI